MANNPDKLSFTVLDGLHVTRAISTSARLTISHVAAITSGADGIVTIMATPAGFLPNDGYAVALCFSDDTSDYATDYTPVWVKMGKPTAAIVAEDGTPEGATIGVGHGLQLKAVIRQGDAVKSWATDSKRVAVIDAEGWLMPATEGTVTVTVTTVQGATATYALKVSAGEVTVDDSDEGVDQDKAESRKL